MKKDGYVGLSGLLRLEDPRRPLQCPVHLFGVRRVGELTASVQVWVREGEGEGGRVVDRTREMVRLRSRETGPDANDQYVIC